METKLSRLVRLIKANEEEQAIRFAAKFQDLGEHKAVIKRGAEFLFNPAFFHQLGYDRSCVDNAFKALQVRYAKQL